LTKLGILDELGVIGVVTLKIVVGNFDTVIIVALLTCSCAKSLR